MLIYVKSIKKKILRMDRQTDGQPKTMVRNLEKIGLTLIGTNVICEVHFINRKIRDYDLDLMAKKRP